MTQQNQDKKDDKNQQSNSKKEHGTPGAGTSRAGKDGTERGDGARGERSHQDSSSKQDDAGNLGDTGVRAGTRASPDITDDSLDANKNVANDARSKDDEVQPKRINNDRPHNENSR
jgi:hypothetical protein